MLKPKALKYGDTIGIVAPASPTTREKIIMAKYNLEKMGFKVKIGESCYKTYGYLAGTDEFRARDLNSMFEDENINGIMCLRGGYGSLRILNMINYESIKNNPKVFIGYSDITAMHIALNQISNLITFHGPMFASDISSGLDDFSMYYFIEVLTNTSNMGAIRNPKQIQSRCFGKGIVSGKIIGGNLATIVSTLGTKYEINTKGKILLIEDINEEPYKIDRMLTQLSLSKKLEESIGIIIGDFNNCKSSDNNSLQLSEVFENALYNLNKPIIQNLKIGHSIPNITIPLGVKAAIDTNKSQLIIEESATIQ